MVDAAKPRFFEKEAEVLKQIFRNAYEEDVSPSVFLHERPKQLVRIDQVLVGAFSFRLAYACLHRLQFCLAHGQKGGWCGNGALQAVLEEFCTDYAVLREHFRVSLFHKLLERCEALVDFLFAGCPLSAVPFGRQTFLTCGNSCAPTIDSDAAKDGCLSVCFCLLPVDVEQDLECTSHVGLWLNG